MTRNSPAERALVERLRAKDPSAVAELQAVFGTKIHQLALRHLKNTEDAEEVTQDVLLKAFRKISAFRGDSALSSWVYRITFNAAMSRLRSTRFHRPLEISLDHSAGEEPATLGARDVADWSALGDEGYLRRQLRRRFKTALRDMPRIYRTPVILRDVHGLSTEEASERLRINSQTLKSRLHRGRLFLRDRLSAFSGGLSLHPAA